MAHRRHLPDLHPQLRRRRRRRDRRHRRHPVAAAVPARPRRRRDLDHAVLPLADGRRRVRRRRLPRHRAAVRHPGRRRRADRARRTTSACGSSSTSSRTTRPTSTRWFQAALAAGPGSPERARYIFRPGRGADGELAPTDWESAFGGPAWTRLPDGDWYLHLFAPEQPDFNWENPEVVAEFEDILRFWLDRGVDGFRIDVANALKKDQAFPDVGTEDENAVLAPVEGPHHPFWDRDDVHEIYRGWRRVADAYAGDRMFVAEAWVDSPDRLARYVRPDELHTAFNFNFVRAAWDADELRDDHRRQPSRPPARSARRRPGCCPTTTSPGTRRATAGWTPPAAASPTRPGSDPTPRSTPRSACGGPGLPPCCMLALPGSAYVYQGEELGLPEVVDLPEDVLADPIWERSGHTRARPGRLPGADPVDPDRPVASASAPARPWLPQPADWAELSVEAQEGVEGSTLELYRTALRLRARAAARRGPRVGRRRRPSALMFRRRADDGSAVGCLVNLGSEPVPLPAYDEVLVASGAARRRRAPGRHRRLAPAVLTANDPFGPVCTHSVGVRP